MSPEIWSGMYMFPGTSFITNWLESECRLIWRTHIFLLIYCIQLVTRTPLYNNRENLLSAWWGIVLNTRATSVRYENGCEALSLVSTQCTPRCRPWQSKHQHTPLANFSSFACLQDTIYYVSMLSVKLQELPKFVTVVSNQSTKSIPEVRYTPNACWVFLWLDFHISW